MNAHSIDRSDGKTRGGAGLPGRCGSGRASIDHHKFQTARNASLARHCGRVVPRLGRFFASSGELIEFEALRRAGIGAGIAAQVAAQFVTPQREVPAADPAHQMPSKLADVPEVVHVDRSSIRLFDSHDANENGLTDAQILFAPGAKADD